MPGPGVAVVIPTLRADQRLVECLRSLENQTYRNFETWVVDNSGRGLVRARLDSCQGGGVRLIENVGNAGFGAAFNQAGRQSGAELVATLNDDTVAHREWLEQLVSAMQADEVGMCASSVRLMGQDRLDSAGMLVAGDGSSKQRGHGSSPADYENAREALLPSGSAAIYRRAMLEEIGWFDEDFFLFCEDTDLGLRGQWAGWRCAYAPGAAIEHHYSHSAGQASAMKAFLVERNRIFVAIKNFPAGMLAGAPLVSLARYWWHLVGIRTGRGAAARYREQEDAGALSLAGTVVRAHWAAATRLKAMLRKRRQIRRSARLTPAEFRRLVGVNRLSAREVAEL